MTAVVAPQASEEHGPELLRLSMGPLFLQVPWHVLFCTSYFFCSCAPKKGLSVRPQQIPFGNGVGSCIVWEV